MNIYTQLYNLFNNDQHLQPVFSKQAFEKLHGWEFGWEILEPINISTGKEEDEVRLSPGQKALYFFWYLDAQVTNGGFIQFYLNGYHRYTPPIIDGLKLIDDTKMLSLFSKANKLFYAKSQLFYIKQQEDDFSGIYNELEEFDTLDSAYYELHDNTMELLEKHIRENPDQFVKLQ